MTGLLVSTGPQISSAQISVRGKVVDSVYGQGIGYATVSLLTRNDSAMVRGQLTDTVGTFLLTGISPGRYILQISSVGYRKRYLPVFLQTTTDAGIIRLTANTSQLTGIQVSGSRPAFRREDDKLVLNISGNKLFATAANGYDILKKIPGLQVNGDGTLLLNGRTTPVIFVNGKQLQMSPEEQQQFLSSLSPDMLSSIEVINTPSSRYDGEFKAILDIRLKQDPRMGWKGAISTNLQQNAYTLSDNNLMITYRAGKMVYTARMGYTGGDRIRRYHALQHLANTDILTTNTRTLTGNNNLIFQAGADYNIAPDQRISLLLRGARLDRNIRSFNTLDATDATVQKAMMNTYTDNRSNPLQHSYAANLDYSGKWKKTQLDLLTSYVNISNRQDEDIQTHNAPDQQLLTYWLTNLNNDITIRTAQADVSINAGKATLLMGGRFAFTTTSNKLRYDTLDTPQHFVTDSSRTNNFLYNEYTGAAYISYSSSFKKLNYNLSLRTEYTHTNANSFTKNAVTERNYLKWLPGISVTYAFNKNQQLNVAYSRRLTRPTFTQLNPFRFYNSPLNYYVGNPDLKAATTDMLAVSYTYKNLMVTVNAGREWDAMVRYPEYDSITNVLEYLGKNIPFNDFAGVQVSFPLTVTKWWRMNHQVNGYYKKEQMPYHQATYRIPVTEYDFSGSQVFTLPAKYTFEIYYAYHSRGGNSLYKSMSLGNVDLSLQKQWMNGKLNTRINYYDIFDTYRVLYIFREKQIINNQLSHWFGNRKFALTVAYNFGRSTHKAMQEKKNEEENRVGL
ncbi:OMP-b-brl-3 domain-containing protein [Chitinophaga sp. 180180018-2]|nr:OMP-b-brl-3 domain-containing protein [Chitinophaga sp. 212800010-3]